jgi:hypothetical protein
MDNAVEPYKEAKPKSGRDRGIAGILNKQLREKEV